MINLNTQKLLCLIVVNDELAEKFNPGTEAYLRAFIVKERDTGVISAWYRFKQVNGTNWYQLHDKVQNEYTYEKFRSAFEHMLTVACTTVGVEPKLGFFCPPDDKGDPFATIKWLEKQDLINITHTEPFVNN